MVFRNAASFGKRQEYIAVAELLRRHFDVYMTLVDDQQIDCVIRQEKEGQLRYLDIQIKARSNECIPENAGRFAAMEIRAPRDNFFFIFYSEQANTYWILPSLLLIEEANQNKEGVNKGKYSINFCNVTAQGVVPRPRFRQYENAFDLLELNPTEARELKPMEEDDIQKYHGVIESSRAPLVGRQIPPCWEVIKKLEGQTLQTLAQNKKFKILKVTEKNIIIEVNSTKKERTINFEKEIEPACKALKLRRRITRIEIEDEFAPRNPAFVAAILANLSHVRYMAKPVITLFFD